jgi:hypothetical protein
MKKIILTSMLMLTGILFLDAQVTTNAKTNSLSSTAKLNQYKKEINFLFGKIEKQFKEDQAAMDQLKLKLEQAMKELETQDKMGNFEIQTLMSTYNQAEQLRSSILKTITDTKNAVIQKIGFMAAPM